MKELRLSAADGEWRVAFAFDPERRAVLLVAGEKSGGSRGGSTARSSARPMNASTGTLPSSPMKEDRDDREP